MVRPFRKHIDAASILSLVWMLLWERTFKLAILFFYLCLFWISLQLFFIVGDCEVKSANPTVFLNFRRSASVTWTAVSGSEAVTADTKFWGKKKNQWNQSCNSKCRFRISLWTECAVYMNRPTNQRGSDFIVCAISVNHEKLHLHTSSGAASNDTFKDCRIQTFASLVLQPCDCWNVLLPERTTCLCAPAQNASPRRMSWMWHRRRKRKTRLRWKVKQREMRWKTRWRMSDERLPLSCCCLLFPFSTRRCKQQQKPGRKNK